MSKLETKARINKLYQLIEKDLEFADKYPEMSAVALQRAENKMNEIDDLESKLVTSSEDSM
jgi:hypothetical protein